MLIYVSVSRVIMVTFPRREGDSNPRYAFDVYTLSRRASSATRASLQSVRLSDFYVYSHKNNYYLVSGNVISKEKFKNA